MTDYSGGPQSVGANDVGSGAPSAVPQPQYRGAPTPLPIQFELHASADSSNSKLGPSGRIAASNKDCSIDDCLQAYTCEETLDEANQWYCSRCKEHRRATKEVRLWRSPDVLILHLKRFSYKNRVCRDKIEEVRACRDPLSSVCKLLVN
jgi:hypothetical protein